MSDDAKEPKSFYETVYEALQAINEVKPSFVAVGDEERFGFVEEAIRAGEARIALETLTENLFEFEIPISHNLHQALEAVFHGTEYVHDKDGTFLRFDSADYYLEMLSILVAD